MFRICKWMRWSYQFDSCFLGCETLFGERFAMYHRVVMPSSSWVRQFLGRKTHEAKVAAIVQNVKNDSPNNTASHCTKPALSALWVLGPQMLHLVVYVVSLGLGRSSSLHWAVSCSPLTVSTVCLGKLQKEGRCCWNWTKLSATRNIGRTRMSGKAVLWFIYVLLRTISLKGYGASGANADGP
jgi:hypothetical protein